MVDAPHGAALRVDTLATAAASTRGHTAEAATFSRPAADHGRVILSASEDDDGTGGQDGQVGHVSSRDVSGLAVPWDVPVRRFGVDVTFTADTLRVPDPIDAVKLLVQHDDERPIGQAAAATSDDDGLRATFTVPLGHARTAEAMADLDARLREGLSVGVEVDPETIDAILERLWFGAEDDAEPIPLAGVLREVSLVSIPQFLAARVDAGAVPSLVTFERRTQPMTPAPTTRPASTLATHDPAAAPPSSTPTAPRPSDPIGAAFTLDELAAQLAPLLGHASASAHPLARYASLDAFLTAAHDQGTTAEDGTRLSFALADQITANNPGVLPPTWLTDVAGVIDRGRPAITAFGGPLGAGDTGMTINWPYYDGDPSTLVDVQAAEKTQVTTGRVDIKSANATLATYAGASDISYQLLKRSSPSYRELYARILAIAFAIRTDTVFCADLIAGGTAGPTWDGESLASLTSALFGASAAVSDALGSPASIVLAAPDVFALIGNLDGLIPPAYGTVNVGGTAQASTLAVSVSGLAVTPDRNLPAGSLIVSGDGAAAWREDGPYPIEAEDVAVLGRDVGIWGMGVTTITVAAAVLKLGVVPPVGDAAATSRRQAKS
jgi:HK97 family phage prohead protease